MKAPSCLYEIQLQDNLVAAVRDIAQVYGWCCGGVRLQKQLCLQDPLRYFQSGLLIFNLERRPVS